MSFLARLKGGVEELTWDQRQGEFISDELRKRRSVSRKRESIRLKKLIELKRFEKSSPPDQRELASLLLDIFDRPLSDWDYRHPLGWQFSLKDGAVKLEYSRVGGLETWERHYWGEDSSPRSGGYWSDEYLNRMGHCFHLATRLTVPGLIIQATCLGQEHILDGHFDGLPDQVASNPFRQVVFGLLHQQKRSFDCSEPIFEEMLGRRLLELEERFKVEQARSAEVFAQDVKDAERHLQEINAKEQEAAQRAKTIRSIRDQVS